MIKSTSITESKAAPPWLERLLSTAFFSTCKTHSSETRSDCNMYCLHCNSDAFCVNCKSAQHEDHQVIQIRRNSYHDVVRVSDIQNILEISGVQIYSINGRRVVFLNKRPQQSKSNNNIRKDKSHFCEICGRTLLSAVRFCSLGCKLARIRKNGDASVVLSDKKKIDEDGRKGEEEKQESVEGMQRQMKRKEVSPIEPVPVIPRARSNSSKRKGIPRRAPFF